MMGTIPFGGLRGVAAFLVCGTVGTGVFAAEPERASSGAPDEARRLFREGNEAYRAKDLERARTLYQESIRVERSFDAVCNLGRTEADLFDDALALLHLDECLREYPPGDAVAAAREKFYFLREEVRQRCRTKDCSPPKSEGVLAAPAVVEGPAPNRAPVERSKPATGSESESQVRWPLVLALGGAGVVAATVGTVLWLVADGSEREARELREEIRSSGGACGATPAPGCAAFLERADAANLQSTLGVVGWSVGGALLASSLVVAFAFPEERATSSSTGVRIAPLVGGVFGGVVSGSF